MQGMEYVGGVNYTNPAVSEEGGIAVRVSSDGIHIGAYTREDGDTEMSVPVADCRLMIELLQNAVDQYVAQYDQHGQGDQNGR